MSKSRGPQELPEGLSKDPKSLSAHNLLLDLDSQYASSILAGYKIHSFDGQYSKPNICVADVNYFFSAGTFVPRRLQTVGDKPLLLVLNLGGRVKYCLGQRNPALAAEGMSAEDAVKAFVLEAKALQTKLVADIQASAKLPSPKVVARSVEAFYAPQQVQRPRTA